MVPRPSYGTNQRQVKCVLHVRLTKKTHLHVTLSDKTRLHAFNACNSNSSALHCNGLWLLADITYWERQIKCVLHVRLTKYTAPTAAMAGYGTAAPTIYVCSMAFHHQVCNLNNYQNGYKYQCQLYGVDQLY